MGVGFAHGMLVLHCSCPVPAIDAAPEATAYFDVYGVHLASKGPKATHEEDVKRLSQCIKQLTECMTRNTKNRIFFVVGGDWNEDPNTIVHLMGSACKLIDGPKVPQGTNTMTPRIKQGATNDNVTAGPFGQRKAETKCKGVIFRKRSDCGLWRMDDFRSLSDHFPVYYSFAIDHQ